MLVTADRPPVPAAPSSSHDAIGANVRSASYAVGGKSFHPARQIAAARRQAVGDLGFASGGRPRP